MARGTKGRLEEASEKGAEGKATGTKLGWLGCTNEDTRGAGLEATGTKGVAKGGAETERLAEATCWRI